MPGIPRSNSPMNMPRPGTLGAQSRPGKGGRVSVRPSPPGKIALPKNILEILE